MNSHAFIFFAIISLEKIFIQITSETAKPATPKNSLERDEVSGALDLRPDDVPEERVALAVADGVEAGDRPRVEAGVGEDLPGERARTHGRSTVASDLERPLSRK